MNQIAFIFRQAPYGYATGREGVDALLATSVYTDELAAFFMDDGVYQLIKNQQPEKILTKDHTAMFKLCDLYDIEHIYVAETALSERNIAPSQLLMPVTVLAADEFRQALLAYPIKLMF